MKPTDILTISEPVEQMYMDCQSQLIINICKHFKGDDLTPTAQWEFQKLSELDAVTQESIEIIAANTGKAPEVIEKAITEGLKLETIPTEKVLSAAANKGYIMSAANGNMWETSQGVKTVISNLTEQAVNDSNIVNTVMLNSTRERYINAVQNAAADEVKLIEQLQGAKGLSALNQQLAVTQTALNTATTSVVTGVEARTTAVRRVISELAEQGITGFVDRAGHHWSPEAYINMDIRTTVHNAAVQGQKARSADYGVTTFQISSHAGARPLCAPYQGKFYSWDNTSGVVEDLYGGKHSYKPLNSTSYGQPAGIFGINCGHFPLTFVNGYSIARYKPTEDDAENAKRYQLMQRQRYMERNIRTSKTKALAYKAAGDDEAFKQTAGKIASQNAQYKAFCKANGLTQRLERTQVVGYNRDIAKQAQAARGAKQSVRDTIELANKKGTQMLASIYDRHTEANALRRVSFSEISTSKIGSDAVSATYSNISVETANVFNSTINKLASQYDTPLQKIRTMTKQETLGSAKTFARVTHTYEVDSAELLINPVKCQTPQKMIERVKELQSKGYCVNIKAGKEAEYIATHEFTHTLLNLEQPIRNNWVGLDVKKINSARNEVKKVWEEYAQDIGAKQTAFKQAEFDVIMGNGSREKALALKKELDEVKISEYSLVNADEFMAEAFTNEKIGIASNQYAKRVVTILDKYFGR